MKNTALFILVLLSTIASCKKEENVANRFKKGAFEIPAGENYGKTIIIRKDSLQIELYETRIDSLRIIWKDNFNYTLKMLHPKRSIDNDIIHVRITKLKKKSYDFEATIGFSNFKQKGSIYIIDKE